MSRNGTHPIGIVVGKIRSSGTGEVEDLKMETQVVSHKLCMKCHSEEKSASVENLIITNLVRTASSIVRAPGAR